MKKTIVSLLIGAIFGGILSFLFLGYEDWSYTIIDLDGTHKVNELDMYFVFNAGLIISIASILVFVIWTIVFICNVILHQLPFMQLLVPQLLCN